MAGSSTFGPAIIGEEAYRKQQEFARTGGQGFGKLMLGPVTPAAPPPAADAAPVESNLARGAYSVKDIQAMLAEAPARTYDLAAAEFNRPDGPRKTVLKLLREVEEAKGDDARPALLDLLTREAGA